MLSSRRWGWQRSLNRPSVLLVGDEWHLWYTGQGGGKSRIGHATSADGVAWRRRGAAVLQPSAGWELGDVMCPSVLHHDGLFRMWYSAGRRVEPDAIGYATSADGVVWAKHAANPVFSGDTRTLWERDRVSGSQVLRQADGTFLMLYIGFEDQHRAAIGLAWSRDGVTGWVRHPSNPVVSASSTGWDEDSVYKPSALLLPGRGWLLWYNGRRGGVEQIGVALHAGADLGWPPQP